MDQNYTYIIVTKVTGQARKSLDQNLFVKGQDSQGGQSISRLWIKLSMQEPGWLASRSGSEEPWIKLVKVSGYYAVGIGQARKEPVDQTLTIQTGFTLLWGQAHVEPVDRNLSKLKEATYFGQARKSLWIENNNLYGKLASSTGSGS